MGGNAEKRRDDQESNLAERIFRHGLLRRKHFINFYAILSNIILLTLTLGWFKNWLMETNPHSVLSVTDFY